MTTRTCPGCGRPGVRATTTVTLLEDSAGPAGRRARVCRRCAAGGLVVVAPRVPAMVRNVVGTGHEIVREALRLLDSYERMAHASVAHLPIYDEREPHLRGRLEGLQTAIETLRACAAKLADAPPRDDGLDVASLSESGPEVEP